MDFPKSVPGVGLINGQFIDENMSTGQPGSLIPSVWGNSVTQEILNVLVAGGLTPDEFKTDQLAEAISKIATGAAVAWNKIAGKPTTVAGYGIKDVYTRKDMDTFLAAKVIGDSCPIAGFYAGSKTRPYMLHADETVVELPTLAQLVATNTAVTRRVTGDSCPTAGFYGGSKTRPYMLHADETVVELPTLEQLVATNSAVSKRITSMNCAQAGFVDGTSNTPFMTHTNGTTVAMARADAGIGYNRKYVDVTASRAANIVYTNDTGAPMAITISFATAYGGEIASIYVGGVLIYSGDLGVESQTAPVTFIVPKDSVYSLALNVTRIQRWVELR